MRRNGRVRTASGRVALALLIGTLGASSVAAAQPSGAGTVTAPAGGGQQALAVRAGKGGVLAKLCASAAGCTADGGTALDVPEDVGPLVSNARASVVKLAGGKSVVRVEVDGAVSGSKWILLVAAPVGGGAPITVWNGWTGAIKGEHGEGRTHVIVQEKLAGGAERILIAERRDDVAICGRPTLVSAQELDPAKMSFVKGARVENLDPIERGKAVKLLAARAQGAAPAGLPLLRATAASSAVDKKFATLTDGDPATSWSENRPGEGKGEFVPMSMASEVGVTAIDLRIRPTADVPDGAAPKRFFLATEDKLFEVTMPEDAWSQADARYEIKLPAELHASCIALVLEEAYAPRGATNPRVTVAEVTARTAFDGASLDALVGALAGGGPRSQAAAALLSRGGAPAMKATIAGYAALDEKGKQLAMGVIDAGQCAEQVPFFAERLVALAGKKPVGAGAKERTPRVTDTRSLEENELAHARDRIRRCGRAAAPVLAKLVAEAPDATRVIAASELALLAPAESVPVLLDGIGKAREGTRRELRTALAQAARSERAWPALAAQLEPDKMGARSAVAQIDLLRALGPSIGRVRGSGRAFAELARPAADSRARYLLLAPAADLARSGDATAALFLRSSLRKDADPHVRARAAEVAAGLAPMTADLVAASDDPDPRVREAAAVALAHAEPAGAARASAALVKRLGSDPWTFVRASSARSVGALPGDRAIDRARLLERDGGFDRCLDGAAFDFAELEA